MNKQWQIISEYPADDAETLSLARDLGVTPLTAGLLKNRGISDKDTAVRFLSYADNVFHDPFLLAGMDVAVDRIERALECGEKIAIYGDYDVDGVTSTSLLYLYLKSRGASDLTYYIPGRTDEGYGMNTAAVEKLAANGVRLIVTVDTGVTAIEETELARELGMDVVITDHHECMDTLPDAVAVVNPMRCDEKARALNYPFTALAGVGVAFKLVCAMEMRRLGDGADYLTDVCDKYVDLAAIGTIADVMPLLDENRLFVSMGLRKLNKAPRPAVKMLLDEVAKKSGRESHQGLVTSSVISYTLAPRINAAGRMSHADKAVCLFLSDDESEIRSAAAELCEINKMRQDEENRIVSEAVEVLKALPPDPKRRVLVLAGERWNSGVIGIVASRITERYGMPSILISFDGDAGKGSGRSIKGLNLVDALADSSEYLTKFGGHELAAGLSIERSKLPDFIEKIEKFAYERVGDSGKLMPKLTVDFEVHPSDLTLAQADQLRVLEPYGAANPVPLFLLRDAKVVELTELAGKHTKLTVKADGLSFVALMFGSQRSLLDIVIGDRVDLVFELSLNEFRGVQSVQLIVRDYSVLGVSVDKDEPELVKDILSGEAFSKSDNFLPCRDDFAKVYIYLRHKALGQRSRDRYTSNREFLVAFPEINYVKLHLILEILAETGLITVSGGSVASDLAIYELSAVRQKIDLERSELYIRLRAAEKVGGDTKK